MHVCFVFHRKIPDTGSTAVTEYARHLSKKDVDVSYIGITTGDRLERDEWEGIQIWRIPSDPSTAFSIVPTRFGLRAAKLLRREASLSNVDVIYLHGFPGVGATLTLPGVNSPIVADIRGTAVSNAVVERVSHAGMHLQKQIVDKMTVVDDRVASRIFSHDHDLDIIPLGADFERFRPNGQAIRPPEVPSDATLVGYVGHLHPSRDLGNLIRSFARVNQQTDHAHLALIGDGQAIEQLQQTTSQLGLRDHVHFTGSVPHEKIPEYIRGFDIMAAYVADKPQYRHQPPIKTVEALATGCPTLATSTPGNQRFITGENAQLASASPFHYGKALIKLVEDEDLRQSISKDARDSVRQYDYEYIVEEELLPVLQNIIK